MRILGLDIGSTSIKAVEIDFSFGKLQVHDYHRHAIDPTQDLSQALRLFLGSLPKAPDKTVVGISMGQSSFRTLSLPVKDRKSLNAGVAFELEDDLPFDLEVIHYDFSILEQQSNQTSLYIAYCLKNSITTLLETLIPGTLDPDIITTEAWAFRSFFKKTLTDEEATKIQILIHMGHTKTILYAQILGKPIMIREIKWGGQDLTSAICQKYGIPIEQAEKTLLEHGFVLSPDKKTDATPDQVAFSDTIMESLSPLMVDIRQSILSAKSQGGSPIGKLFVSGGPSRLPGLLSVFEAEFQIKTEEIKALSLITKTDIQYPAEAEHDFTLASALALTPLSPEKGNFINFRKGFFSKQGGQSGVTFKTLKIPLLQAAAVMICFIISVSVQNFIYKDRIVKANSALEKNTRQFFPGVSNNALKNYLSNTTLLKNDIQKELTRQRELANLAQPNPNSPLDFLKMLSTNIYKSTTVDLMEMKAGASPKSPYSMTQSTQTSLTFIVPDQKTVDQIITTLSSRMTGLEKTPPEKLIYPENAETKTERLKFSIKGKLNDKSYGR